MRKLLTLVVACLVVCAAMPTHAQTRYSYLYQATNEILQLQRATLKMTPNEAAVIANNVCKTLETLLRDENFKKDLREMGRLAEKHSAHHRELADNLVFFVDSFVPSEKTILDKTSLSPEAKSQMLAVAGALRESLREPKSSEQLWNNIIALRQEVCKATETLAKGLDDEKSRAQRWRTVKRWGLGLAGLSMVSADILFAAPTGGVATASVNLGSAAVAAALAPLPEPPR